MGFSFSDLNVLSGINKLIGNISGISDALKLPSVNVNVPELPQIPLPPTVDDAARAQEQARLRRRRGRAATILTGPQGAGTPVTATKTLLGG